MRALRVLLALALLQVGCGDDNGVQDVGPGDTGGPDLGADTVAPPDQGPDLAPDGMLGDGLGDGLGDAVPDAAPVFSCDAVTPPAGNNAAAVTLTLDGYLFESGATVALVDAMSGTSTALGAATVSDTDSDGVNDQATVDVPASTPQGLYGVEITNPTTGETAKCGFYTSTTEPAPTVTDVIPDTAWEGSPNDTVLSDQPITVKGTGFKPVPTVRFVSVTTKEIYQASTTGFISDTSLSSICPSESLAMPVGDYYVDVINPSQLWARWMANGSPGIFKVTATPPPVIEDVSPYKIPANAGGGTPVVTVTVTGDYFDQGCTVLLLLPDGTTLDITSYITAVNVSATGKDTITFTWDNTVLALAVGIYPLRVTNPDLQYDTFYSMLVENAAPGKLNADNWVVASQLNIPRERHASVAGFDVFANSYLYTVGGTTPDSGGLSVRPRTVLASTEVVEVDVFGSPAGNAKMAEQLDASVSLATIDPKHDTLRSDNLLNTKRSGLTLVRAGLYLYAIGGADADTWDAATAGSVNALKSVERARILGYATRPNLSLPTVAAVTKGLPKGAWYYRVSAVVPNDGESLPSREVVALNAGGAITLKWLPVTGATSYMIYRSLAADGRPNSTRLIQANVTGTSFTDDGQGALAPAPGFLAGKLATGGSLAVGNWTYRVSATVSGQSETLAGYPVTITTSTGDQTIELAWNPIPNATYSLYRTDAADSTGKTYLLAAGLTAESYTDDGTAAVDTTKPAPDGTAPLPSGSLSYWSTLTSQLNTAREGPDAVVVKAVDGDPTTTDEPSYIFVVGGRSDNATNTDYLKTTERAQVDPATGTLGTWTVMQNNGQDVLLNVPRAFYPLLSTQGRNEIPSPPPPVAPPCPDNDGDGFTDCKCGGTDCDDNDATVYPGATEICGDGKDQDCDQGCAGGSDVPCNCTNPDADGDGYDSIPCGGNDCNDNDKTVHPGATEICGDGIDQDCDGKDLPCPTCEDKDGDGFEAEWCGGTDCNDNDATICPDKQKCPDLTCDGIDQDCDGMDMLCYAPHSAGSFSFGVPQSAKPITAALLDEGKAICAPVQVPWWMFAATASEEPVHLVVVFGDSSYIYPTKNQGLQTAEVALVRTTDGTLSEWTLQTEQVQGGTYRYGNDGLLYHDFVFSFQGVLNEDLGQDPPVLQIWNNVLRYEINTAAVGLGTEPVPADFLQNLNPAHALMNDGRVYLSVVRLNAYIFGIAGNIGVDGTLPDGPTDTIERIKQ
jgi:hypothetical protein